MTLADMAADYWAHRFYNNPKEKDAFVDENWNEEDILAEFAAEEEAEARRAIAKANPDEWETL